MRAGSSRAASGQASSMKSIRRPSGPLEPDRGIVDTARVADGIAGMVQRRDHKAGLSQRRRGIMMAARPSAPAVRDNDQRQPLAGDGTILHAGHVEPAQPYL